MRYIHYQVTNTYTVLPDWSVFGTSTHGWWWDLLSTSTLLLPECWDQWSHDQVMRSGDEIRWPPREFCEGEVGRCSEAVGALPWKQGTHHEPSPIHWADSRTVLETAADWNKGEQEKKDRSNRKRTLIYKMKWGEKDDQQKWEELGAKTVYNDGKTRKRIGVSFDYTM